MRGRDAPPAKRQKLEQEGMLWVKEKKTDGDGFAFEMKWNQAVKCRLGSLWGE